MFLIDAMEYDVPFTCAQLMDKLCLKSRDYFRKLYLLPAIELTLIVMIIPDKPTSWNQSYIKKVISFYFNHPSGWLFLFIPRGSEFVGNSRARGARSPQTHPQRFLAPSPKRPPFLSKTYLVRIASVNGCYPLFINTVSRT